MLTLLLGGARSGKSALAVEIGRRHGGPVTFLATSPHLDDLSDRISRHRAERPPWPTVEEPLDLAGALGEVPADHLVVVDCLTLWVSNLMARGDDDATIDVASGTPPAPARHGERRRSSSATRSASASTPRRRSACGTGTSSAASTRPGRPGPRRPCSSSPDGPSRSRDPWEHLST